MFISKKIKTKYQLEFVAEQLNTLATQQNLEMFKTLMETKDPILSEPIEDKFRKRFFSVSSDSLKATERQVKYYYALRKKLDVLHKAQIQRRKILFEKFKEICLNFEFEEEQDFVERYCKKIDMTCLREYFNFGKNKEKIEFKFYDVFFDEMMKGLEEANVRTDEMSADIKNNANARADETSADTKNDVNVRADAEKPKRKKHKKKEEKTEDVPPGQLVINDVQGDIPLSAKEKLKQLESN